MFKSGKKRNLKRIFLVVLIVVIALYGAVSKFIINKELTGVMATEMWSKDSEYDHEQVASLVKNDGKDFKILILSDIQLESDPFKDRNTLKMIEELVEETTPDFIMTTGDNSSWMFADMAAEKLVKKMESFDIPWGVTIGNHDDEGRADRNWTGNLYENAENSVFKMGPSTINGVGNYAVNIVNQDDDIIYTMVMMDSNTYRKYDINQPDLAKHVKLEDGNGYDFIYENQINWYEWLIKNVSAKQYGEYNPTENKVVPSLVFFHIPLIEFNDAKNTYENGDIDKDLVTGKNEEDVFSAAYNTGFFEKAKELQSTTHITVGHDHVNSLSIPYQGIRLNYGLKTGNTSYSKPDMQGGVVMTIKDGTNAVEMEYIYINNLNV